MSKTKSVSDKIFRWVALGIMVILATAGILHLLAGVDAYIAYPVSVSLVALLVREVL